MEYFTISYIFVNRRQNQPRNVADNHQQSPLADYIRIMIYEQFGNLKYKYREREFWCRGYYVDTVGKNKQKIAEYIKHQLDEDKMGEQLTMLAKDDDPFKGGK